MRLQLVVLVGLLSITSIQAAEPAKRFGIEADLKTYPQTTAKETLASVLKAIENKRYDYLVAQLADPEFIDQRVKRIFGGKFEDQVEDTRLRLDSSFVKMLQRFAKDGEWVGDGPTTVMLKDVKDRSVTFIKVGDRWFMQHSFKPE